MTPQASATTLFVCVTCRGANALETGPRPGARLFAMLKEQTSDLEIVPVEIVPVECLSNCQRGCSAAVSAPGKWTYVVGDLDPDRHAADILTFARQHQAQAEGLPVWRERPAHVRKNTIARVPPMPVAKELA